MIHKKLRIDPDQDLLKTTTTKMIEIITKTIITTIEEDLLIEEAMKNIKAIIKNSYMEIIIKVLTMSNTLIITKIIEVGQEIDIEIEVIINILRIIMIKEEEMGV
jgi:hypothetical protein